MSPDSDDDLSCPDLGYADRRLNELWAWIRDDLAEQGRVYNHQILANADQNPTDYPKSTLDKDLLSDFRDALQEKNIIDVAHEDGDDGVRKVWIITGDTQ